MNVRNGKIIRVDFFVPTENMDEAFQSVHTILGEHERYQPTPCDVYDENEKAWYFGGYNIDTTARDCVLEMDDDGTMLGVVDVESEVRF